MTDSSHAGKEPASPAFGIISFMWVRPFTQSDLSTVDRAHQLGFTSFELVMPDVDTVDFGSLGQRLNERGMQSAITARVGPETDPCHPDSSVREAARTYLHACIDAAAEMGASIVGGPLLGRPLIFAGQAPRSLDAAERRRRLDLSVQHLSDISAYAAERGVRLALEPVNRFETDILNLVEQANELLDLVGAGDTLGILLDTFHANIEEESVPKAIALAGSRLLHVHANENHRGVIGTGHLPWPEIMDALHEIDYRGQVVLEPFRRNDNAFSVPLAFWRPPDPAEDEQVANSLQYLQGLATGTRA